MDKPLRKTRSLPRHAMIRRATLQRLCPQGKQRRPCTPAVPLAHRGKAASPNAPQAAGPCSWACRRQHPPPPHPKRNAASKPPAHGAWAREHGANGAGRRHCRPRRPAAVNTLPRLIRNETQRPSPLLVGLGRVNTEPRLWLAAPPPSWACRRQRPPLPHPTRNAVHPPPARGAGVLRIRANGTGRRHCRLRRRASRWRRGRCRQGRCRWRTGERRNPAER